VMYNCSEASAGLVVGSWLTRDGFIVVGKDVFDEWQNAHPSDGPITLVSVGGDCNPLYGIFPDGSRIDYKYT